MRDVSHEYALKAMQRQMDLQREKTVRNVFSRGKTLEALSWNQLPVRSSQNLQDPTGLWWFIVGYSTVGGGDRVP